ncbi:hypothetical protein BH23GEM9_BH23GEM9_31670 [soil metagenome]
MRPPGSRTTTETADKPWETTPEKPGVRPLILVVEDNPHDWEIYGKILWYNGFDCIYAANGIEGLSLARQHRPDVIVLDIGLPGIDGLELCRRLHAEPATRDMPVIFLTAAPARDFEHAADKAGCAQYIEKPASPVELLHAVEALVGRAPPAGEGSPPRLRDGVHMA